MENVQAEYPGVPCFLFGHSTGGAVVLKVSHITFNSQYVEDSTFLSNIRLLAENSLIMHILSVLVQAASNPLIERMVEGVILTSPALRVKPAHPVVKVSFPH